MKKKRKTVDPADRTFFANLFTSIAEEMGVTLTRTAYSPNIKERRDFSCALFDSAGNLIAQAAHIPVHLGAMPMSVKAALDAFDRWHKSDVVMLNDPYRGGTHLPDITLVSPVIVRGTKPVAFISTRAHHADVGGMSPGSLPISREIVQEGLRIPPIKLVDKGKLNEAVLALIHANVRTPEERSGDLRAQLAAHETGTRRFLESAKKYGVQVLLDQMGDLLQYGSRLMKSVIKKIPNGSYSFEDVLDDDGVQDQPIKIKVKIIVQNDRAIVDFSGSDPECAGSLNAVEAITRSAVYYCFLCLLVTPSKWMPDVLYDPPLNSGCFEPVQVICPKGTIVNANPPRAVAGGNVETSQRIVDVVFGALAKALPQVIPAASQGTMNNLTIGGYDTHRKKPFAYYETIGGGMGARPEQDGVSAVQVHMTNTMNTPVEAMEFALPVRVERYEIAPKTGGAGSRKGGDGIRRDIRLLCDAHATLLTDRRLSQPFGLNCGGNGKSGKNRLIRSDKTVPLPGKVQLEVKPDDVISIQTPGGGGWGKRK